MDDIKEVTLPVAEKGPGLNPTADFRADLSRSGRKKIEEEEEEERLLE